MLSHQFSALSAQHSALLLHDLDEVGDLGDHSPHLGCVLPLHNLMHAAQTQASQRLPHLRRTCDAAADLLEPQRALILRFCFLPARHYSPAPFSVTSSSVPRSARYSFSLRSCLSASKVAFTTLCGLAVPRD